MAVTKTQGQAALTVILRVLYDLSNRQTAVVVAGGVELRRPSVAELNTWQKAMNTLQGLVNELPDEEKPDAGESERSE